MGGHFGLIWPCYFGPTCKLCVVTAQFPLAGGACHCGYYAHHALASPSGRCFSSYLIGHIFINKLQLPGMRHPAHWRGRSCFSKARRTVNCAAITLGVLDPFRVTVRRTACCPSWEERPYNQPANTAANVPRWVLTGPHGVSHPTM